MPFLAPLAAAVPAGLGALGIGGAGAAGAGGAGLLGSLGGAGGLLSGAGGLLGGLFGGGEQSQTTTPILAPGMLDALQQHQNQLSGFQQEASRLAGQIQSPTLQTQFAGPSFQQQLDPFSQRLVSQGTESLARGAGRAQQDAARAFRGQGALGNILGQQAAAQARLQANPLLFQAAQQQRDREAQEFALRQGSQQLTNQALLQQAQAGNQALGQRLGLLSSPLTARQNLLSTLAGLSGSQVTSSGGQNVDPSSLATGLAALFKKNSNNQSPDVDDLFPNSVNRSGLFASDPALAGIGQITGGPGSQFSLGSGFRFAPR
jgi:hypothetical protein